MDSRNNAQHIWCWPEIRGIGLEHLQHCQWNQNPQSTQLSNSKCRKPDNLPNAIHQSMFEIILRFQQAHVQRGDRIYLLKFVYHHIILRPCYCSKLSPQAKYLRTICNRSVSHLWELHLRLWEISGLRPSMVFNPNFPFKLVGIHSRFPCARHILRRYCLMKIFSSNVGGVLGVCCSIHARDFTISSGGAHRRTMAPLFTLTFSSSSPDSCVNCDANGCWS